MQITHSVCVVILLAAGAAHAAEVDLDLSFGLSEERQDRTNQWSFGAMATFGEADGWLRPEVGIQSKTYPIFGGLDREFTVAGVKTWKFERNRLYFGAGYAHASFEQGANRGSSNGPFARAGILWPIGGGRFSMGVDIKRAWLRPWQSFGANFDADYSQVALRLGWRL